MKISIDRMKPKVFDFVDIPYGAFIHEDNIGVENPSIYIKVSDTSAFSLKILMPFEYPKYFINNKYIPVKISAITIEY